MITNGLTSRVKCGHCLRNLCGDSHEYSKRILRSRKTTKVGCAACAVLLLLFAYTQNNDPGPVVCLAVPDHVTSLHPYYGLGPATRINAERLRRARSTCDISQEVGGSVDSIIANSRTRTAYCVVPKTSCTFWVSMFAHLQGHGSDPAFKGDNPLHPTAARFQVHGKVEKLNGDQDTVEELADYFRFMFVRDPYSRLWSAYVDKFLLLDFWISQGRHLHEFFQSSFGLQVLRRTGQTYGDDSSGCHSNVTFAQFATFVAFSQAGQPERLDEHWRPVQYLCDPCLFCPHLIGHVETFLQDSQPVLERLNMSWVTDDYDHAQHQMTLLLRDNFHVLRERDPGFYLPCTDPRDVARRLWRAFQLYGYLPDDLPFPDEVRDDDPRLLRPEPDRGGPRAGRAAPLTDERFLDAVLRGRRGLTEAQVAVLGLQRARAMQEAYRSVPSLVLERLSALYLHDFLTFGYDPRPEELFGDRYS